MAHEPHRIAFYLYDLAAEFHALWNRGNDDPERRFLLENNPQLSRARLELALGIGADHPERPGADGGRRDRGDALTMSRRPSGAGLDRLPWLPDEPKPQRGAERAAQRGSVSAWAFAAIAARRRRVLLDRHAQTGREPVATDAQQPATTVALPAAASAAAAAAGRARAGARGRAIADGAGKSDCKRRADPAGRRRAAAARSKRELPPPAAAEHRPSQQKPTDSGR